MSDGAKIHPQLNGGNRGRGRGGYRGRGRGRGNRDRSSSRSRDDGRHSRDESRGRERSKSRSILVHGRSASADRKNRVRFDDEQSDADSVDSAVVVRNVPKKSDEGMVTAVELLSCFNPFEIRTMIDQRLGRNVSMFPPHKTPLQTYEVLERTVLIVFLSQLSGALIAKLAGIQVEEMYNNNYEISKKFLRKIFNEDSFKMVGAGGWSFTVYPNEKPIVECKIETNSQLNFTFELRVVFALRCVLGRETTHVFCSLCFPRMRLPEGILVLSNPREVNTVEYDRLIRKIEIAAEENIYDVKYSQSSGEVVTLPIGGKYAC